MSPSRSLDDNLVRALRMRAASDPAFRESLARVVTGDAKYEDYVERKRREGQPWLEREEWEAYVFGKDAPARDLKRQRGNPMGLSRDPRQVQRMLTKLKKKRVEKKLQRLWEPSYEEGGRAKRMFSVAETRNLPQWAAQPHGERDRLLAQAKESQPLMVKWLNQGKGVDKAIGARTVRRDKDRNAPIDLDTPGPVLIIAPPKTKEAADDKVRQRYGGDWREGAVDLVRATIAVDQYEDFQRVVDKLKESGLELACKPRNRFRNATSSGYRDAILNARLPNGHIMEIQLHLKPVLKAKEENHDLYTQIRHIAEESKSRDELTDEERRLLDENTMRMRRNYDSAWEEAVRRSDARSIFDTPPDFSQKSRSRSPSRRKAAEDSTVLFFDVDGLPVRWEAPKFPEIHGGSEVLPVKELAWFVERAVPIQEDEFTRLVKTRERARSKTDKRVTASDGASNAVWARADRDPAFRRVLEAALISKERK